MRPLLILLSGALAIGCARPEPTPDAAGAARDSQPAALPAAPAPATVSPQPAELPGESAAAPAGPSVRASEPAPPVPAPSEPAAPPAAQMDSANRILERAAARYAEVRSLQASFTMSYENPLLRSKSTGTGVLYQQRPDRLLLRFNEPAGDVILSDGRYFWIYYPSTDATQVLRSEAAAGGAAGVDLQAQFLGDPTRRFRSELVGEAEVGGRATWELRLTPRERLGYRQLRVWIDRGDFLARRFEITEENGSVRRFDLSGVRVNPALSADLFKFDVPAGARVVTR